MLDLSNYTPPSAQYKCKDCANYYREGNDHSQRVILRCSKKPFYVLGRKNFHTTKANNPACPMFKKSE